MAPTILLTHSLPSYNHSSTTPSEHNPLTDALPPPSSNGLSTLDATVVLAVVGGLVFLLLVGALIFSTRRRRLLQQARPSKHVSRAALAQARAAALKLAIPEQVLLPRDRIKKMCAEPSNVSFSWYFGPPFANSPPESQSLGSVAIGMAVKPKLVKGLLAESCSWDFKCIGDGIRSVKAGEMLGAVELSEMSQGTVSAAQFGVLSMEPSTQEAAQATVEFMDDAPLLSAPVLDTALAADKEPSISVDPTALPMITIQGSVTEVSMEAPPVPVIVVWTEETTQDVVAAPVEDVEDALLLRVPVFATESLTEPKIFILADKTIRPTNPIQDSMKRLDTEMMPTPLGAHLGGCPLPDVSNPITCGVTSAGGPDQINDPAALSTLDPRTEIPPALTPSSIVRNVPLKPAVRAARTVSTSTPKTGVKPLASATPTRPIPQRASTSPASARRSDSAVVVPAVTRPRRIANARSSILLTGKSAQLRVPRIEVPPAPLRATHKAPLPSPSTKAHVNPRSSLARPNPVPVPTLIARASVPAARPRVTTTRSDIIKHGLSRSPASSPPRKVSSGAVTARRPTTSTTSRKVFGTLTNAPPMPKASQVGTHTPTGSSFSGTEVVSEAINLTSLPQVLVPPLPTVDGYFKIKIVLTGEFDGDSILAFKMPETVDLESFTGKVEARLGFAVQFSSNLQCGGFCGAIETNEHFQQWLVARAKTQDPIKLETSRKPQIGGHQVTGAC